MYILYNKEEILNIQEFLIDEKIKIYNIIIIIMIMRAVLVGFGLQIIICWLLDF